MVQNKNQAAPAEAYGRSTELFKLVTNKCGTEYGKPGQLAVSIVVTIFYVSVSVVSEY
jgi:hypothetical protein